MTADTEGNRPPEAAPWRSIDPARIQRAPTMLWEEELQFLYYAASELYTGAGEIVDAGAFLGGSAAALACGLRDNPRVADRDRRIASYDSFAYDFFHAQFVRGGPYSRGDDVLPEFVANLGPLAPMVAAHKGEIKAQTWDGRPIELLFVDFTQTLRDFDFVVRNFYRHLIPGKSLLIHQDYIYVVSYWLHVSMEQLADWFEVVARHVPSGTAAWRLVKPLPEELFERSLEETVSFARMCELFDRSLARYSGEAAALLALARARMIYQFRGPREALAYLERVRPECERYPGVVPRCAEMREWCAKQIGEHGEVRFCLDTPAGPEIDPVSTFSGWYLPPDGSRDFRIALHIAGEAAFGTLHASRPDVGNAFPNEPYAAACGFVGDVVLPADTPSGAEVRIAGTALDADGTQRRLFDRTFRLAGAAPAPVPRALAVDLAGLLQDPDSGDPVSRAADGGWTTSSGRRLRAVCGVPHFHPPGQLPVVRLRERGSTHPHGDLAQSLIDSSGLVLDFGGGAQAGERLRRNVINLDAIQFPGVDVVCTHPRLPLRAGSFDAVVSQAAFQHLRDPGGAVREILRVLKPGGRLLIDTAFMQPDHGDPERYFNMTCRGLLSLLDGFVVEQAGVQPYQTPSNGLIMQLNSVIPLMRSGRWHDQLVRLLADLRADGAALDRDLGAIGRETLAAGVFVLARKP